MAKTQDIKRRIRSIRNTMQLTRAMKMVAAAKLRRSQERILRARPYARRLLHVLRSVAVRANPELHPLLQQHGEQRMDLVVLTADKGLCGAFNTNIIRTATGFAARVSRERPSVIAVGKKGRDFFARRDYEMPLEWDDISRRIDFPLAAEIAQAIMKRYTAREVDTIHLVYNEFKSAIQCKPTVVRLLPIDPLEPDSIEGVVDYIYEPDAQSLFDELLPHYVEVQVFHALIESAAAEHAARMTAMDSATKNAGELIDSLTLTMNRVRQAAITTEIIEVVSGAEALGG